MWLLWIETSDSNFGMSCAPATLGMPTGAKVGSGGFRLIPNDDVTLPAVEQLLECLTSSCYLDYMD